MQISESSQVTLHFSLELENGDLIDSTFGKNPATFTMGDGSLLKGFEKRMIGLKAGDKDAFLIPQEDGFGASNPNNIQQFKRSTFSNEQELAEGLIMSFADANGGELPGVIKAFDEKMVTVDFNHPLAGNKITFRVEIHDVK
ncbi:MAG: FKBP-type peptidyl-prolyl cis-trans isomerase [Pseudomonadales bacterium]|nr:FKBP-type peptidyl-prolyl cis-trans isomerase [Pseudomonadales bacterium]